jgi:hypothetical protein
MKYESLQDILANVPEKEVIRVVNDGISELAAKLQRIGATMSKMDPLSLVQKDALDAQQLEPTYHMWGDELSITGMYVIDKFGNKIQVEWNENEKQWEKSTWVRA